MQVNVCKQTAKSTNGLAQEGSNETLNQLNKGRIQAKEQTNRSPGWAYETAVVVKQGWKVQYRSVKWAGK